MVGYSSFLSVHLSKTDTKNKGTRKDPNMKWSSHAKLSDAQIK